MTCEPFCDSCGGNLGHPANGDWTCARCKLRQGPKKRIRKDQFEPGNPAHFRLQTRGGAWRYYVRRCVLLAIGDHDPKGLHIVEGLHRTFMSCANIKGLDWDDPEFDVVNIGLTEEQISTLGLMKIDNLETGGGRDLSDHRHPDHFKPYVQNYIGRFGVWKCEANALVGNPDGASAMLERAINRFIPASHPRDVEAENEPGQADVRSEISRLMKTWTFDE